MGTGAQPSGAPQPGMIFDMLLAYERTAALRAAIELDLFRAVGEGPGDVDSLARSCSASARGIRILCDYLTINGLLTKQDGRYGHTPTSVAFLDPHSPSCIASISRFLGNSTMVSTFQNLAEVIRNGRTQLPGEGSVEPENPIWVEFAHSMAPMMAPVAAPLGAIVLEGLSGPVRVLDIATGHGLFGIEVAKQHPHAHVVAVDWAPVLDVAKGNACNAGVEDRFEALPGSAFDVDYGGPYDIVLITNNGQATDLAQFTSLGIDPTRYPTVAVKSMHHFRAAFEPIARQVVLVDTGALCSETYTPELFSKVRRPIYPLDALA